MKLHKAIPLALACNNFGWKHKPDYKHIKIHGDPISLTVTTVDGLLTIKTDHPGVGDWMVRTEGMRGWKAANRLSVVDGQLCRVNGLTIPLSPFELTEELPMIYTERFSALGKIPAFSDAWNLACKHASDEPSRYTMNGIAVSDQLAITATNGKILFTTWQEGDFSNEIIIPIDAATLIGRLDGDLSIAVRKEGTELHWAHLQTADASLYTRLMEGNFPNVQNVIPTSAVDLEIRVETPVWQRAWKAVKTHPDSNVLGGFLGVVDICDGRVTIRPPQQGERPASIEVPATVKGTARRTFGINADYALAALPGDVLTILIRDMPNKSLEGTDIWYGPVCILGDLGQCLVMTVYADKIGDKDVNARLATKGD